MRSCLAKLPATLLGLPFLNGLPINASVNRMSCETIMRDTSNDGVKTALLLLKEGTSAAIITELVIMTTPMLSVSFFYCILKYLVSHSDFG